MSRPRVEVPKGKNDAAKAPKAVGEHHDGSFGVYMAHKKSKLDTQFGSSFAATTRSLLFEKVSIWVDGYTNPPFEELKLLVGQNGGHVDNWLSGSITHIVATNLPDSKVKQIRDMKKWMPVVYPTWITDSIARGKQQPYANYLLPAFKETGRSAIASFLKPATSDSSSMVAGDGGGSGNGVRDVAAHVASGLSAAATSSASTTGGAHSHSNLHSTAVPLFDVKARQQLTLERRKVVSAAAPLPIFPRDTGTVSAPMLAPHGEVAHRPAPPPVPINAPLPPRTTGSDPRFMEGFFSSSRLHFIGSWRSHVQSLVAREQHNLFATSVDGGRAGASTSATELIAGTEMGPSDIVASGEAADLLYCSGSESENSDDDAPQQQMESEGPHDGTTANGTRTAHTVAEVRGGGSSSSHAATTLATPEGWPRIIAHVDVDCFFAQVALLEHPHLKDEAVVVAHGGGVRQGAGASSKRQFFGDGVDTTHFGRGPAATAAGGFSIAGKTTDSRMLDGDPVRGLTTGFASGNSGSGDGNSGGGPPTVSQLLPPASTGGVATNSAAASSAVTSSTIPSSTSASNSFRGGEISSANYVARKFGIHAGMPVGHALTLCKDLHVLPYNFDKIQEVSEAIYHNFLKLTPRVQAVSCDEAYLDLTGLKNPLGAVAQLRKDVEMQTGCTVSAGIAPNLLLARIATGKAKPNGMFVLPPEPAIIDEFMLPLPASSLPGIGWGSDAKLQEHNIYSIAELRAVSRGELESWFGAKRGFALWQNARGIDNRSLKYGQERKSIGVEVSWGVRFATAAQAHEFLRKLCVEVSGRMAKAGSERVGVDTPGVESEPVKGRGITFKLMVRKPEAGEPMKHLGHGSCDSYSRTVTLPSPTCDVDVIAKHVLEMYASYAPDPTQVRGVGVQVTKLMLPGANTGSSSVGGAGSILGFLRRVERVQEHPIASVSGTHDALSFTGSAVVPVSGLKRKRDASTSVQPYGEDGGVPVRGVAKRAHLDTEIAEEMCDGEDQTSTPSSSATQCADSPKLHQVHNTATLPTDVSAILVDSDSDIEIVEPPQVLRAAASDGEKGSGVSRSTPSRTVQQSLTQWPGLTCSSDRYLQVQPPHHFPRGDGQPLRSAPHPSTVVIDLVNSQCGDEEEQRLPTPKAEGRALQETDESVGRCGGTSSAAGLLAPHTGVDTLPLSTAGAQMDTWASMSVSLRRWIQSVGAHPAPLQARFLLTLALRYLHHQSDELVSFLRGLKRYVDEVTAEAMECARSGYAVDSGTASVVTAWVPRGDQAHHSVSSSLETAMASSGATWRDAFWFVESSIQEQHHALRGCRLLWNDA